MSRVVAIVGRPNVGKSRLFNRIARRRLSIVHDQPGITRDIISANVDDYTLLDTGGLGLNPQETPDKLIPAVETQVHLAISMASLILFVVDGRSPLTNLDEKVGQLLRKSKKNVLLVINKNDNPDPGHALDERPYKKLGFGENWALVSAEHGHGELDLREAIAKRLGPVPVSTETPAERSEKDPLKIAFVGRPNVGKSSLSNCLLGAPRLIVSDIPGTTRDSVEIDFTFEARDGRKWPFRLFDTAGLKHETKLNSPVEYFSRNRSMHAIERADVVFFVLDAFEGVTKADKQVGTELINLHKPIIVLVNKWDLALEAIKNGSLPKFKNEREFRKKYEYAVHEGLFFTPGSPVIFVSAKKGLAVERMLGAARKLDYHLNRELPTGKLNAALLRLTERVPPPAVGGKRFRAYYAVQTGTRPTRIRIFCNQEATLTDSYRRYLENGLVEEFGIEGCPMLFNLVGKEKQPRPDFLPDAD